MFWLLVVGVVSLSIGFVMGATFRQYRPIKPQNDQDVAYAMHLARQIEGSNLFTVDEAIRRFVK